MDKTTLDIKVLRTRVCSLAVSSILFKVKPFKIFMRIRENFASHLTYDVCHNSRILSTCETDAP